MIAEEHPRHFSMPLQESTLQSVLEIWLQVQVPTKGPADGVAVVVDLFAESSNEGCCGSETV